MQKNRMLRLRPFAVLLAALLMSPGVARAGQAEEQFKEGYFQQTHEHDFAAAAKAYEKVLADQAAPAPLRAEARTRLSQCQEEQAAANLAQLMPPDAVLYFEISQPGKHIGQILGMVGLAREPNAAATASPAGATPLPGGFALPGDFSVSPALIRELQKARGIAVAITGVDQNGIPSGVALLHPGDAEIPRGLIETGIQVLPQSEPIGEYKVYQVEGKVWIAATSRLFIVSDSREQIGKTIGRLQNPKGDSLATQPQFNRLEADRKSALAFVYLNGRRALEVGGRHLRGQEAMIARTFLDLEHLESFSAAVGTSEKGIHAQAKIVLAGDHRNLAYGIIRTAPLTKRSLANVPAGAAAVAVLGLNPAEKPADGGSQVAPSLTAMDIGREVFANVEEISLFLLPSQQGESPRAMPEVGMIAAVKDPAKSEALWDQLLSLAAMFGPQIAEPPKEIEIEGHKAKQYQFKGAPPIVVMRLADRAMAAGTPGAVKAALGANKKVGGNEAQLSITADPRFKPLLDGLKSESSKAVLVHAGRLAGIVASTMPRGNEDALRIGTLLGDLKLMIATSEKPTEFVIQATATGLPNVPRLVEAAMNARPQRPTTAVRAQSPDPVRTKQKSAVPQKP